MDIVQAELDTTFSFKTSGCARQDCFCLNVGWSAQCLLPLAHQDRWTKGRQYANLTAVQQLRAINKDSMVFPIPTSSAINSRTGSCSTPVTTVPTDRVWVQCQSWQGSKRPNTISSTQTNRITQQSSRQHFPHVSVWRRQGKCGRSDLFKEGTHRSPHVLIPPPVVKSTCLLPGNYPVEPHSLSDPHQRTNRKLSFGIQSLLRFPTV